MSGSLTVTCPTCGTTYLADRAQAVHGQTVVNCTRCGPTTWEPRKPAHQPLIIAPWARRPRR